MEKLISAADAVQRVLFDGATVMVGGFGIVGCTLTLVTAINESPVKGLTVISNNLPEPGSYLGKSLLLGKVAHAIGTYFPSRSALCARTSATSAVIGSTNRYCFPRISRTSLPSASFVPTETRV